ncbi:hypothetical protein SCHAM137S_02208 [Streptomyces chartreusis]
MAAKRITYAGLDAPLTPEKSVLLLIDYQGAQFAGMRSMDANLVLNNMTALAKGAKLFDVPTILTTVVEDRGGHIIRQLQDVFPDQTPIDRTAINTWEDQRVVDAVAATGRKDLIMAGLWTDICLAWPDADALRDRGVPARRGADQGGRDGHRLPDVRRPGRFRGGGRRPR